MKFLKVFGILMLVGFVIAFLDSPSEALTTLFEPIESLLIFLAFLVPAAIIHEHYEGAIALVFTIGSWLLIGYLIFVF